MTLEQKGEKYRSNIQQIRVRMYMRARDNQTMKQQQKKCDFSLCVVYQRMECQKLNDKDTAREAYCSVLNIE